MATNRRHSGLTRFDDGRLRFTRPPTKLEIDEIGRAPVAEFDLKEKEIRDLRAELYKINHDKIRRYRTVKEGNILLVWRIK